MKPKTAASGKKKTRRSISAAEFDRKLDRGQDITAYLDFKKAVASRVNAR